MGGFNDRRTSNIFIVILILLNIALLGAFWYKFIRTPSGPDRSTLVGGAPRHSLGGPNRTVFEERFKKFLKIELGFSTEQQDKFMELQQAHLEDVRTARNEIEDLRRKLLDKLLEENMDIKSIDLLASEIGEKTASHEKSVFLHFQGLSDICNNEQKIKYRKLMHLIIQKLQPKQQGPPGNRPGPPGKLQNPRGDGPPRHGKGAPPKGHRPPPDRMPPPDENK